MIEKLQLIPQYGYDGAWDGPIGHRLPNDKEMMDKINEIIDKINELEIKTQVTKWFNPELEKELDKILEINNSAGAVLDANNK